MVENTGNAAQKNFKKNGSPHLRTMVEDIIKCKWSLAVLDLIHQGTNRPGAMVRAVEGLTTKVLNERLSKLQRYGLVARLVYPEKPPRVEYHFTKVGEAFVKIIDAIDELQNTLIMDNPDADIVDRET